MDRTLLKSIVLATAFSLASVQPALAYIDPNTGGILFQALAAAFAVMTGFALIFSRQIRAAFARFRRFLYDLRSSRNQDVYQKPGDKSLSE
jgi:hypothetical protein